MVRGDRFLCREILRAVLGASGALGTVVSFVLISGCRSADQVLFERAEESIRRGEFTRAESLFTVYVGHEPREPDGWYNRALARISLRDLDGAMTDLDRTVHLADGDSDARWLRFRVRELHIDSLRRTSDEGMPERPMRQTLISALFVMQLEELSTLLVLDPMDVQVRCERGILWRSLGKFPESYVDLTLALKVDPENLQALTERGNLLHAIGNDSEAVRDYDEALSVCDTCTWLLYNKALALRSAGRLRETVVVLEALVAVNGTDDEAWLMLGDCRLEQRMLRAACLAWQRSAWLGNFDAGERLGQHCSVP